VGPPPLKRERSSDFPASQQQQVAALAAQTSIFDVESQDVLKEKLVPTWFSGCLDGEQQDLVILRHQKEQLLRVLGEVRVKEEEQRAEIEKLKKENRQKDMLVQASGSAWNKIDALFGTLLADTYKPEDVALLKTALETYKSDYVEQLLGAPFTFSSNPDDDPNDVKKVEELLAQRFEKTKKVLAYMRNFALLNRVTYDTAAKEIRAAAAAGSTAGEDGKSPVQMMEKDNESLHSELKRLHNLLDEKEIRMRTYVSQNSELEDLLRSLHKEQEELTKENEELREKARKATTQMCRKLSRDALAVTPQSSLLNLASPTVSASPLLAPVSPAVQPATSAPKKLFLMQQQQHTQQQQHQPVSFGGSPAVLQAVENWPELAARYEQRVIEERQRVEEVEAQNKRLIEANKRFEDMFRDAERRVGEEKEEYERKLIKQKELLDETNARVEKFLLGTSAKWSSLEAEVAAMKQGVETLDRLLESVKAERISAAGSNVDLASANTADTDEVSKLKAQLKRLQASNEFLLTKASQHCPVTVDVANAPTAPQDATPAAAVPAGDAQPQMADEELPQVVTKELRQVIMEEIDKLRHSSDEIVKSLKDQIAHLTSENPASDESVMEEIASIGSVCEQLQQQNTTLSQQLTNQYDQYSKLSRDKMAMELRLSELERDLKQAQQDRMAAMEQLHQQVQMNSQFVVQDRAQSQELFDEKQKSLALASRIEQESGARVVAESDVENLKRKMNEIQKQLDEKGVELTRCSGEKDNLEKEVKREVMGLVWVYRYKLKFALTLLSNSGSAPGGASSSTATSPSKSRWKKNASTSSGSGGPQSRMNLRPEYKSLLPPEDEEIDKFEVSGRALLGSSSADSDGTMVDEDLGSLYRQLVKCSVCGERDRSCVLKRCSHTFCEQCITKCLQNRNRKCPKCHAPFGDADVIKFIL